MNFLVLDTKKRITVFVGHYGSGKTEVAINFTRHLISIFEKVMILDMDVINPFFRTKDMQDELKELGVEVIAPRFANTQIELPSISPEVYSAFNKKEFKVVIDAGGDDQGALALGTLANRFKDEDYQVFYVVNQRRPLTSNAQDAFEYMKEIEAACRLKVTGIINNTNLGQETTTEIVLSSLEYAKELSKLANIPVVATAVLEEFKDSLEGKIENLYPIKINIKRIWDK